jgi:hypothetical protein
VIAWALLRDEKDWEPKRMIEVTELFGKMPVALKETLQNMKPKENSDQRKSRLRKEARLARAEDANTSKKEDAANATVKPEAKSTAAKSKAKPRTAQVAAPNTSKPRRARKPVCVPGKRA